MKGSAAVDRNASIREAARRARNELQAMARPSGDFDASRYFRAADHLKFFNVGTTHVRRLARSISQEHAHDWTVADATAFAEILVRDPVLEVKSVGLEVLARHRRSFHPALLAVWKSWLADDHASNWATTDLMCGMLIGPLLLAHPALAPQVAAWSRHKNMWVRRASAVGLIPLLRRGQELDLGYLVAARLHPDPQDLIQKAVGWMLREAGKADARRLNRYLREAGPAIPRTTVRYAIERFDQATRQALLAATRPQRATRAAGRRVRQQKKR
jgi:3-methyladenine DNA glycosylase AlkD